jgi:hypothetical protein
VDEALERLALLRAQGPSPRAFTFSSSYTAAEAAEAERAEAGAERIQAGAERAEAEPAA